MLGVKCDDKNRTSSQLSRLAACTFFCLGIGEVGWHKGVQLLYDPLQLCKWI